MNFWSVLWIGVLGSVQGYRSTYQSYGSSYGSNRFNYPSSYSSSNSHGFSDRQGSLFGSYGGNSYGSSYGYQPSFSGSSYQSGSTFSRPSSQASSYIPSNPAEEYLPSSSSSFQSGSRPYQSSFGQTSSYVPSNPVEEYKASPFAASSYVPKNPEEEYKPSSSSAFVSQNQDFKPANSGSSSGNSYVPENPAEEYKPASSGSRFSPIRDSYVPENPSEEYKPVSSSSGFDSGSIQNSYVPEDPAEEYYPASSSNFVGSSYTPENPTEEYKPSSSFVPSISSSTSTGTAQSSSYLPENPDEQYGSSSSSNSFSPSSSSDEQIAQASSYLPSNANEEYQPVEDEEQNPFLLVEDEANDPFLPVSSSADNTMPTYEEEVYDPDKFDKYDGPSSYETYNAPPPQEPVVEANALASSYLPNFEDQAVEEETKTETQDSIAASYLPDDDQTSDETSSDETSDQGADGVEVVKSSAAARPEETFHDFTADQSNNDAVIVSPDQFQETDPHGISGLTQLSVIGVPVQNEVDSDNVEDEESNEISDKVEVVDVIDVSNGLEFIEQEVPELADEDSSECLASSICVRWTTCQAKNGKFAGMCGNSGFDVCCFIPLTTTTASTTTTTTTTTTASTTEKAEIEFIETAVDQDAHFLPVSVSEPAPSSAPPTVPTTTPPPIVFTTPSPLTTQKPVPTQKPVNRFPVFHNPLSQLHTMTLNKYENAFPQKQQIAFPQKQHSPIKYVTPSGAFTGFKPNRFEGESSKPVQFVPNFGPLLYQPPSTTPSTTTTTKQPTTATRYSYIFPISTTKRPTPTKRFSAFIPFSQRFGLRSHSPSCSAAMKCVQKSFCTLTGSITSERLDIPETVRRYSGVPLLPCQLSRTSLAEKPEEEQYVCCRENMESWNNMPR